MKDACHNHIQRTSTYTSRPSYTDMTVKDACHNHIQHTSTYTSRLSYTDMIMKDACHDVNCFPNIIHQRPRAPASVAGPPFPSQRTTKRSLNARVEKRTATARPSIVAMHACMHTTDPVLA